MKSLTFIFLGMTLISLFFSPSQVFAQNYDFSWLDPDKKIYVVQNRQFKKRDKIILGANVGLDFGSPFNSVVGFMAHGSWFFNEVIGIRGLFMMGSNSKTTLYDETVQVVNRPMVRDLKNVIGVMGQWTPFYGKLNTFNMIIYYDWVFGLGLGRIGTEVNENAYRNPDGTLFRANPDPAASETYTGLLWSIAFRIYLSSTLAVQVELLNDHYQAPGVIYQNERWFSDHLFMVGLNLTL